MKMIIHIMNYHFHYSIFFTLSILEVPIDLKKKDSLYPANPHTLNYVFSPNSMCSQVIISEFFTVAPNCQ